MPDNGGIFVVVTHLQVSESPLMLVLMKRSFISEALICLSSLTLALGLMIMPLKAQTQNKPKPGPTQTDKPADKPMPFVPPESPEQWVAKYKTQGWAKCRMSAIDTFSVTAGKASTEVFVAMRQLTDAMEEIEKLLEQRGVDNRTLKSALQAEAHLISVMTLEQKGSLFRECVHSLW